nr:HAD-IIB family hydrolase [Herbaspirillum rhizosphaerae]
MQALSTADKEEFKSVRVVLTDMDETLTHGGRLAAATYGALEALQADGVRVIPVTAAPAGWCDQMARMWPIDGVIGENGGLFFRRGEDGQGVVRQFWHDDLGRMESTMRLQAIVSRIQKAIPEATVADDQAFRMTSIAFFIPRNAETRERIVAALRNEGADVAINNLWILGWLGGYDKLSMTRRVLAGYYGVDIDDASGRDAVLYSGDSVNDAPMFGFFRHTVGVSTVVHYLDQIAVHPRWITAGPGGSGFVEASAAVMRSRADRSR